METRKRALGRTGLEVTEIGMGGIPIINVPFERAVKVVRRAYDLGINYFDNARAYRDSESKMGKALRRVRKHCIIATKTHHRTAKEAWEDLETSLRELKTDYIDIWQLHDVSTSSAWEQVMAPKGALEAAKKAQRKGYVRFIGFSGHNLENLDKAVECGEFDTILLVYNLAVNDTAPIIQKAHERGIGIAVMKPLSGGIFFSLTKDKGADQITPWTAWRFVLSNEGISVALCGAKRIKDLQDAIRASRRVQKEGPMPPEEARRWVRIAQSLGEDVCRGCNYCALVCPEGINIPVIMQLLDHAKAYPYEWPKHRKTYHSLEKNWTDCRECRKCEQACPFDLPILERMQQAHDRFAREI